MSVLATSKFYIPLPKNDAWDLRYPTAVIEAVDGVEGSRTIQVLAPESFAKRYAVAERMLFIQCSGPARELDKAEYLQLMRSLREDFTLPQLQIAKVSKVFFRGAATR